MKKMRARVLSWWYGVRIWMAAVWGGLGGLLVIAAIALFLDDEVLTAIGALGSGAPLVGSSLSLFVTARNEPETVLCTSDEQIKDFLRAFIRDGSNAHVASDQLSWVRGDASMEGFLQDWAGSGHSLKIFLTEPDEVSDRLSEAGCQIVPYATSTEDRPRFTLLNRGRRGSEKLAVVREGLPTHWIDIYNDKQHPQVIELAEAYLRYAELVK